MRARRNEPPAGPAPGRPPRPRRPVPAAQRPAPAPGRQADAPSFEAPPPPGPGAAHRRPVAPPWSRWLLSLAGGLLLAALAAAWTAVAHTVPLPAAWLRAWPPAWPASAAYWAHAVLVMALPLGALGWAGGAVLQHAVALQHQAAGLRTVALLPWLLACPALALRWALATAEPLHALLSLAAGGQFVAAWLALPLGLAWATRRRRQRRRRHPPEHAP